MKKNTLIGAAVMAAILHICPSPALAQPQGQIPKIDTLALAKTYMANGRPDLACSLLNVVYGPDTASPDAITLLAGCSRASGKLQEAERYYQRLIALAPNAPALHLDLATLYVELGRPAEAQREFATAARLMEGTAASPALNRLAQQLGSIGDAAALAQQRSKLWQVELFSGLTRDSNINAGPASNTIAAVIGGLPATLTLTDESAPQKAWGWVNSASASYLMPLTEAYALLAQGSLATTHYFGEEDFGNDSAAGGLALLYRKDGFNLSLQPNIRMQRLDSEVSETDYGFTARATQWLGDGWNATGSLGYAWRNMRQSDSRDSKGPLASAGASYSFGNGIEAGGEMMIQREIAEDDVYSRRLIGPVGYVSAALTADVTVAANYRYARVLHDEQEALFPETRRDDQHILGLSADWMLARWDMAAFGLRAQYSYIRNVSSIELYDYDRHIGTVGAVLRF